VSERSCFPGVKTRLKPRAEAFGPFRDRISEDEFEDDDEYEFQEENGKWRRA
jgi:hypothetical protein